MKETPEERKIGSKPSRGMASKILMTFTAAVAVVNASWADLETVASSSLKLESVYTGVIVSGEETSWQLYEIWTGGVLGLYGDEYALVPVTGEGAITPVIFGDAPADVLDSPEVWTDQKMFDTFTPKGVPSSSWDDDDDNWEYEADDKEWTWPKEVWPNNAPVANRSWILVHAKEKAVWSGVWSFRVGLAGTSEISEPFVVVPSEFLDLNGLSQTLSPGDFFRGIEISGHDGFAAWNHTERFVYYPGFPESEEECILMQTYELENWQSAPMTFTVSVPSAGTLVVASDDDDESSPAMQNAFAVTGAGIVDDSVQVNVGNEKYYPENFWCSSYSSRIRRIQVSGATTLTFAAIDEDNEESC